MSENNWTEKGATLSHKNACKIFGLTEDEIITALKSGKLQYRKNYAHGNPYFKVLRAEVESLALKLHGSKSVNEQQIKHKLKAINTEISSLKRKLTSLEKQKTKLAELHKKKSL